jgi:hypothetical protein
MFWLSTNNEILVLFNDAQSGGNDNRPAWLQVPNPWTDGLPENDPALVPPEGLSQPQRGFGMVWRGTRSVSDRLGWATDDENAFTMTVQQGSGDQGNLYITDPTNVVIALLAGAKGWLAVGAPAVIAPTLAP